LEWPALVAESRDWLGWLQAVAGQMATVSKNKKRMTSLPKSRKSFVITKPTLAKTNRATLPALLRNCHGPPRMVVRSVPEMEKQQQEMSTRSEPRDFSVKAGIVWRKQPTGLQNVVRQLWELLSHEKVEEAKRGYGATIMRG